MTQPLLSLRQISRKFTLGEQETTVLKEVSLDIMRGEILAIVGQSGSGKTTLMNIIGCLDKPSAGAYTVAGRDTADMSADELAQLRRDYFGFIFQRYQLLGKLSATDNVTVPAIYTGQSRGTRIQRARALLNRLGLGARTTHRPSQLSGGQQQRVSIARALINGGEVILADEPTGALDSQSGLEVMAILDELHAEGHTVILVTHNPELAQRAQRVIEISDGCIVSDVRREAHNPIEKNGIQTAHAPSTRPKHTHQRLTVFKEAFVMATQALRAHKLRTFLNMLGIVVGIASVVTIGALGNGLQSMMTDFLAKAQNLEIYARPDDGTAQKPIPLSTRDVAALRADKWVRNVRPHIQFDASIQTQRSTLRGVIMGANEHSFEGQWSLQVLRGRGFYSEQLTPMAQEAAISQTAANHLSESGIEPLGASLVIQGVPVQVVAIVAQDQSMNPELNYVFVPYDTATERLTGQKTYPEVVIEVAKDTPVDSAKAHIKQIITPLHGRDDVALTTMKERMADGEKQLGMMSMVLTGIGAIALFVGGVGMMNVMLMSVTERTQEIGVRMAVGARQRDIQQQFLIEAVVLCVIGGLFGLALAWGIGQVFNHFTEEIKMKFLPSSMLLAILVSTLVGIVFGFVPARNAARLNPVEILSRD